MEEASSRQARLRALREKAAESQGVLSGAQGPLASHLPQPLLADPFPPAQPRPTHPSGPFNFYSNPLSAYSTFQPAPLPASQNVLPRSHLTPAPLAPGTSWRAPSQGPFSGSQGLLPGPPPGAPPGWPQSQPSHQIVGHRPQSNSPGGWRPGGSAPDFGRGAFGGRGAPPAFGRGTGGAGFPPSGGQRRWEGGNTGGQDLSRGAKAPRFDGGGRGGGGRGGGGRRGREEEQSARTNPELFFHKSMLEDPWAELERAHARRPAGHSGPDESWLPPSLQPANKGPATPEVKVAPGSSLASALAGALDAAHNEA